MMTERPWKWWKAKGCTCPGDECSHCATSSYYAGPDVGTLHGEHCTRCGYSERWYYGSDGIRTILETRAGSTTEGPKP